MPSDSNLTTLQRDLAEISSRYLDWYMKIIRKIMYPETVAIDQSMITPDVFTDWVRDAKESGMLPLNQLQELEKNHNALLMLAQEHIEESLKIKKPPEYAEFNILTMIFEGFMDKLRRLEKDMIFSGGGLESLTGLKSSATMKEDLRREMDRLARKGKPFSLALLRINNFDNIVQVQGRNKSEDHIRHVANMIKKSLRSFDDAYYISNAEFILSLKQADITGGIRALERLEELLKRNNRDSDPGDMITVSCYVAEPTPEDQIEDLIRNLKKDLDQTGGNKNAVLEYHELSPLQRFVKNQ